jgi:hypothetical protein
MTEPNIHLNPDCRGGKHRACNGDGWDVIADAPTPCECGCHNAESAL